MRPGYAVAPGADVRGLVTEPGLTWPAHAEGSKQRATREDHGELFAFGGRGAINHSLGLAQDVDEVPYRT